MVNVRTGFNTDHSAEAKIRGFEVHSKHKMIHLPEQNLSLIHLSGFSRQFYFAKLLLTETFREISGNHRHFEKQLNSCL